MDKALLVTRPEHDPLTRYLSKWSEKILEEAGSKKCALLDLRREKAERKRVIGTMEKHNDKTSVLVVLNGHGNEDCVTGHDNAVILQVGDTNAVKGKVIFARACRAAKNLGQFAAAAGAAAFLGYQEDFWLVFDNGNLDRHKLLEDSAAALFLEPSNHVAISLLKGHTAEKANEKSKEMFRKNIEKLVIAGPTSDNYGLIRFLFWDMTNQVCVGSADAKL
jgi:hypothetical protein